MTDQGDGSGDNSYVGDYSVTPKTLYLTPGPNVGSGSTIQLHRMIISIMDGNGMTATEWGNLGSALTNGLEFKVLRKGVDQGIFAGINPKSNASWGALCFDVDIKTWGQVPTDDILVARWTFAKSGAPIRLHYGDEFQINLNDDFTGLVKQHFLVQGIDEGNKS